MGVILVALKGVARYSLSVARALIYGARRGRLRFRAVIAQIYYIGVQSLPLVGFCLAVVALMMVLEFSFHMKLVLSQDELVLPFSTVFLVRELGPVVTALLLTSRIGASFSVEVAMMKNQDQLDALAMLAVDPVEWLIIPRWLGGLVACVCITVVGVAIALLLGAGLACAHLGCGFNQGMWVFTRSIDGVTLVAKAAVFGSIVPLVAGYHGLNAGPGSMGVGRAATSSVVHSSVLIIIADFAVTTWAVRLY